MPGFEYQSEEKLQAAEPRSSTLRPIAVFAIAARGTDELITTHDHKFFEGSRTLPGGAGDNALAIARTYGFRSAKSIGLLDLRKAPPELEFGHGGVIKPTHEAWDTDFTENGLAIHHPAELTVHYTKLRETAVEQADKSKLLLAERHLVLLHAFGQFAIERAGLLHR